MSSSPPIHIPESDWDDEEEHRHDSMAEYREHLFWLRMANAGRTTYPAPEEAFLQHHWTRRSSRSSHLASSFGGPAAAEEPSSSMVFALE